MLQGMATSFSGHAPLEGSLVRLRAREPADASQLNAMFDDPDVLAGLLVAMPQPIEGFREWVEATRARENQEVFAIVEGKMEVRLSDGWVVARLGSGEFLRTPPNGSSTCSNAPSSSSSSGGMADAAETSSRS